MYILYRFDGVVISDSPFVLNNTGISTTSIGNDPVKINMDNKTLIYDDNTNKLTPDNIGGWAFGPQTSWHLGSLNAWKNLYVISNWNGKTIYTRSPFILNNTGNSECNMLNSPAIINMDNKTVKFQGNTYNLTPEATGWSININPNYPWHLYALGDQPGN